MSDSTEPKDLSLDPAKPSVQLGFVQTEADPAKTAEAVAARETKTRERLAELDKTIADKARQFSKLEGELRSLNRERDSLQRSLGPTRVVTQTEAHQAIVKSGQDQRAQRLAQVRQFQEFTGGVVPRVDVPAELAAKSRPRTA